MVTVVTHPLVQHKLTLMRDARTGAFVEHVGGEFPVDAPKCGDTSGIEGFARGNYTLVLRVTSDSAESSLYAISCAPLSPRRARTADAAQIH